MKYLVILIVMNVYGFYVIAQNNIIPNFNFETGRLMTSTTQFVPQCKYSAPNKIIDTDIENWKVAEHSNDAGEGDPDWYDATTCTVQAEGLFGCSSVYEHMSRFIVINSEIIDCNANLANKITHEAVRVSLENNAKFKNNTTYIIRYKIMPTRARVFGSTNHSGGPACLAYGNQCHIRFFLSELGQHWDKSYSNKQELTTANFNLATPNPSICSTFSNNTMIGLNYSLQEREFTTNSGDYTTLVIYAERGGAVIDDVEIFEKCESTYFIQNQNYSSRFYGAGKINFNSNFYEKGSDEIIAGTSVTNTKPQGNVVIKAESFCSACPKAFVNYTAPNKIDLKAGFKVESGAHFRAILSSCPNNLSRPSKNDEIDSNSFQTFGVIKFDDLQTKKLNQRDKKTEESSSNSASLNCNVFPNPTTGDLNVMMFTKLSGNYHFLLEELTGKVLIAESKMILQGSTNISLKLTGVANGMYVLKILDSQDVLLKAEKIIFEN